MQNPLSFTISITVFTYSLVYLIRLLSVAYKITHSMLNHNVIISGNITVDNVIRVRTLSINIWMRRY